MIATLPGLLAIALYLIASILLGVRLLRGSIEFSCQRNHIVLLGLAAALVHAFILYPVILTPAGLNLGFFHAASLIAATTAPV